jgi:demethylmenaquinone methyltransferase/2-methoxy-6-polyprenyl-1,4-benzoquinol methylase
MADGEPARESPCGSHTEQPTGRASSNGVGGMFDKIAPTYVLLNHILSFGLDFLWRRRVAKIVSKKKQLQLLDMATGTGDLLISVLKRNQNITNAVGLDISENMLTICREELTKHKLYERVTLILADAADTGLFDQSYDVVTMGFGIRNTPDALKTLREIHRLLKQNGTALVLEFSLPSNRIIRKCYLLYLRNFVPVLGRLLSGDENAYRYLDKSIEDFHGIDEFTALMKRAGFRDLTAIPLTLGIVCIYKATKRQPADTKADS